MALCVGGCGDVTDSNNNYRPYISTSLAKTIMTNNNPSPDEPVEEKCDGSGWITHGDGHKTPCPGCSACQGGGSVEAADTNTDEATVAESEYVIYHFGAKWCGPCQRLKAETWANDAVKSKISSLDAALYILDADDPDDKKFFEYYGVSRYPTVIFVRRDDLENPIHKFSGFIGPQSMITKLEEQLDE